MWLYLRNILASEHVHFTGTKPSRDRKRSTPMRVATRAVLLGSTVVALGVPVGSRAVSAPLTQPATGGASRPPAPDRPITSVMQMALDGLHQLSLLRDDLYSRAPAASGTPSRDEPVRAKLCQANRSICVPLAPSANTHEWAGKVVVGTSNAVGVATIPAAFVVGAAPSTLSAVAPFDMSPVKTNTYAGEIKAGLHAGWTTVGLPADLAAQVEHIFAGRLDAAKPVQAGDYYRVAYKRVEGKGAGTLDTRVTAAEIRLAGQTYQAVWFVASGQQAGDYYSFDGQRLTAERFAMPLNYVRVSSPFGYRIHPVTGQRLLHTGVDLTAAPGTPVVAASAGTVQFVGYDSGYGKHVVVRHPQGYTSYYAHLSAFARGLKAGMQISQGQPLGAVGETGVATGPHLHFEVRLNDQPTDPLKLTSRSIAVPLAGRQRAAFDQLASVAFAGLPAAPGDLRTASNASLAAH